MEGSAIRAGMIIICAVLWATIICVRGSRVKWRSLGVSSRAPISESM